MVGTIGAASSSSGGSGGLCTNTAVTGGYGAVADGVGEAGSRADVGGAVADGGVGGVGGVASYSRVCQGL
jgi:hypothetical protein